MNGEIKSKTILGPDCRISGELMLDNDAVIMGQFSGTLRVTGMLELTDSAEVSGTIVVGTLRLAGRAEADVVAEDGVELLPGSQLVGQVYTSRLNIVDGAVFQGDVCVGPKATQTAAEALKVNRANSTQPAAQPQIAAEEQYEEEASYGEEMEEVEQPQQHRHETAAPAASIRTNPNSLNAVLQRRRPMPKILSPRPMAQSGNGIH